MRTKLLALIVVAMSMTTAHGQGWAEKMFKDGLTHDFGTQPHGAQLLHRFTISELKWYFIHRQQAAVQRPDAMTQGFLNRGTEAYSTPRLPGP